MHWSANLSSGSAVIDHAHRRCIAALEQLEAAPHHQYLPQMHGLIETFHRCFNEEEQLMEAIGFPELDQHRLQHGRLMSALHEAASKANSDHCASARDLVRLLPQWLLFHWVHMDTTLAVTTTSFGPAARSTARPSFTPDSSHMAAGREVRSQAPRSTQR